MDSSAEGKTVCGKAQMTSQNQICLFEYGGLVEGRLHDYAELAD